MTTMETQHRVGLGRAAVTGAVAGLLASVVMGMYAMIAMWAGGTGFFTPLHHIATLFASPDAMTGSMEGAMAGDAFVISGGVAVLGLVIHMVTGAVYGAIFGLLVARLRPATLLFGGLGLVWGAVVLVVSAFVALPVVAALLGVGDTEMGNPIADMATMAGWGTFTIEHLVYGLVLGLLTAAGLRRA
ncbi:hypothetical protein GCM10027059_25380 [Myceligenerans halotolerans]